jgi:hypothetical protein
MLTYTGIYDLKFSWRLNSMKSSGAISHIRCLYENRRFEDHLDHHLQGSDRSDISADSPRRFHHTLKYNLGVLKIQITSGKQMLQKHFKLFLSNAHFNFPFSFTFPIAY